MKKNYAAIAFAAVTVLLAACSEISNDPVTPQFDGIAGNDPHHVIVTVNGPAGVPGVLVTAKNTVTGDYLLALTDAIGRVAFILPNGSYLFHARNLSDAGPALPQYGGLRLAVAPLPEGQPILNTAATQGMNHASALYTPNGSIALTPENYSAVAQAPLVLSGAGAVHSLTITFLPGATVTCDLIDAQANPIQLSAPENLFVIQPVPAGLPMPPLPLPLQGLGLPRGLLTGATTVAAGGNQCSVAGVATTPLGGAVIESNSVPVNGEEKVFINAFDVSSAQAAAGATIGTVMVAEPRRSFTHYITDPFGDNPGTTDVGLVTGGWAIRSGVETSEFVVAARYRGHGQYVLEISFNAGNGIETHQIRATCSEREQLCRLNNGGPRLPTGFLINVEGASSVVDGKAAGTVIWRVNMPGVTEVTVRVFTGQPGKYDTAPNGPQPTRMKKGGNGNTWVIPD